MRWILLPLLGAIAALLAFQIAAPFESTLARPGMDLTDPAAQFTFGTRWGDVNRLAFGALICGSFCFGLTFQRRPLGRVLVAAGIGAVLGAIVNYLTDSGSDLIGMALATKMGMIGNLVAELAWCVLVPAGIAFTTMVAIGLTRARLMRARLAAGVAAVVTFIVQSIVGILAGPMMVGSLQGASLAAFIPVWRMTELATGIALGMVMAFVDQVSRLGALRLELGRNEFKEWNLDEIVNRIGAAEGVEVPVRGFQGVAPVHAQMTWRPSGFVLDGGGGPVLLNGSPVQSAALSHMDRITVGTATLVFLAHSSLFAVRTTRPSHEPARVPTPVGQPIALGTVPVAMLIDAAGGKYSLPEGRHGVGRDASNPICLGSEASVSRHHAEIVVGPQGIEVVDLGSTNGTRINGRRLTGAATVGRGDCLEFGTVRFTLS